MVLATPFFRHLARPREAEKTEREKVMRNSVRPSIKVPSPRMIFLILGSPPDPVKILSKCVKIFIKLKKKLTEHLLALTKMTVIMRAVGTASRKTSCSPMFWSNSFFSFFPFTGSL